MQARYRLGCVPYVNARPLVYWLESLGDASPVEVVYQVPSRLPALLDEGSADAVLVSSYEAYARLGARIAEGVCIASDGAVESVRLFSKVPLEAIQTLALDASSLTSNRLAQILLAERYGLKPEVKTLAPSLSEMLAEADACVLIGDIGMSASGEGLHVLDLGEAWTAHTGLPFVWALWVGGERLTPELAGLLNAARLMSYVGRNPDQGMQGLRRSLFAPLVASLDPRPVDGHAQRDRVVAHASERSGWDPADARRYLTETIIFDLGDRAWQGFLEYGRKLKEHGFLATVVEPMGVSPMWVPAPSP